MQLVETFNVSAQTSFYVPDNVEVAGSITDHIENMEQGE